MIIDSIIKAEYIIAFQETKGVVWIRKFIKKLGVVLSIFDLVALYCDNNEAIVQAKEPWSHQKFKYVLRRYYLIQEILGGGL